MDRNGMALATLVGVWATFALDAFSTFDSSPQSTELGAKQRADSLWYWVLVGGGAAVGGGAVATAISKKPWPLVATLVVTVVMVYCYKHALQRGLAYEGEEKEAWG